MNLIEWLKITFTIKENITYFLHKTSASAYKEPNFSFSPFGMVTSFGCCTGKAVNFKSLY